MTGGITRVHRLAAELASRVRYAQIVGHPIPAEQVRALVSAARLLHERGEAWPHVVAEALRAFADHLERPSSGEAAESGAGGAAGGVPRDGMDTPQEDGRAVAPNADGADIAARPA